MRKELIFPLFYIRELAYVRLQRVAPYGATPTNRAAPEELHGMCRDAACGAR